MSINDDTHDKLTKAYIEYFKNNEKYERFRGHETMQATRKQLRLIRTLAKLRMDEIINDYQERKNQKQEAKDTD